MRRAALAARDKRHFDSREFMAQPGPSTSSAARILKRGPSVEGAGGTSGIVLPLKMIGDGNQWSAYTVSTVVGTSGREYDLLVDTASSDLWLASTRCGSPPCRAAQSRLYDPSAAQATDTDVPVNYLVGSIHGPVVWDTVSMGGYEITTQALIAAGSVENEGLFAGFSGIFGLALESNSQIAQLIPSVITDDPDGAPYWSNLFGASPFVPRFFSFALERPGFTNIPSVLGIGMHPTSIVSDPNELKFYSIVEGETASAYWRVEVRAITAYVNGRPLPIELGRSAAVPRSSVPVAVFDTGGPVILASTHIANAIYGAWGIDPPMNSDGHFYMPCTTLLNLSITIGTTEYPIHPLDLAYKASPDDQGCTGTIVSDTYLDQPHAAGDLILGVPFLRNLYTVLSFSDKVGEHEDDLLANPRVGMMNLTDPTKAVSEWKSVRIDGIPLRTQVAPSSTATATETDNLHKPKMDVGIIVGIAIISFFALCAALFVLWWFLVRRRLAREESDDPATEEQRQQDKDFAMALAGRGSRYDGSSYATKYSTGNETATTLRYPDGKEKDLTPRSSRKSEYYQLEAEPYQDATSPPLTAFHRDTSPLRWDPQEESGTGPHDYPPRQLSRTFSNPLRPGSVPSPIPEAGFEHAPARP
ncbi:aspartic peptidase domain-containing protein [Auriculariales sp. MPI-PUGE-AT-0066]|nr:aspartic peptidase domain-containing protein [Auriculariales sp. MPI-PUGE-AT-0066]